MESLSKVNIIKPMLVMSILMLFSVDGVAQLKYSLNLKAGINRPFYASNYDQITDFSNHFRSNYTLGFTASKRNFLVFADVELISLGFSVKYNPIPTYFTYNIVYQTGESFSSKYLGLSLGGGFKLLNTDKNELIIKTGIGYYLLGWEMGILIYEGEDGVEYKSEFYSSVFHNSFVSVPLFLTYLHNFTEHIGVSLESGMSFNTSIITTNKIIEKAVLPRINIGFNYNF